MNGSTNYVYVYIIQHEHTIWTKLKIIILRQKKPGREWGRGEREGIVPMYETLGENAMQSIVTGNRLMSAEKKGQEGKIHKDHAQGLLGAMPTLILLNILISQVFAHGKT